ncbi:hypothetical protein CRG98_042398 [Punica granatum]|uniref:Retrovirus-related Pol polyprotein from transposon TNT 1-94 n=1 Tax=Punica granatum TaxID=22663 RepID=A0A2I0HZS0_PUNGR|nr:hypothetical protein CRG98_042398 [Punica granatum]
MSGTRFEVEKFDGTNDFELCRIEIKALLVEDDFQGVPKGKSKPPATLSTYEKIVMIVINIDIKIKDDDHALLLLSILSKTYERFVITMLYGRISITLDDIKATLNSKELLKKLIDFQGSDGERPIARSKMDCPRRSQGNDEYGVTEQCNGEDDILRVEANEGRRPSSYRVDLVHCGFLIGVTLIICHDRELFTAYQSIEGGRTLMTGQTCDIVEIGRVEIEMYDGSEQSSRLLKKSTCLGHGRVNQCKECTMVGKSLKSLVKRYVILDEAALIKQCKSTSRVKVEPCTKATS